MFVISEFVAPASAPQRLSGWARAHPSRAKAPNACCVTFDFWLYDELRDSPDQPVPIWALITKVSRYERLPTRQEARRIRLLIWARLRWLLKSGVIVRDGRKAVRLASQYSLE